MVFLFLFYDVENRDLVLITGYKKNLMNFDFKNIHIGNCIQNKIDEREIPMSHICTFFKTPEDEIDKMCSQKSLDTEILLQWSKLLEYDFLRIYTQHLILFSPQSANHDAVSKAIKTPLPEFRKNIYTKGIIDFILELISTGKKTEVQIIQEYRIPKTTLYRWISKYKKNIE